MSRREIDYHYIADHIAHLSHIQVRIFHNRELIGNYDPCNFPVDPAMLYLEQLLDIERDVSYYITPYDQFYGIVRYEQYHLIIGPTFQMSPSRPRIRDFMFELGIKQNYFEIYQNLMAMVTPMPLELFLHELCLIYYFISEKKLSLSDFALYDSYSDPMHKSERVIEDIPPAVTLRDTYDLPHDTLEFERQMLQYITAGDIDGMNDFFSSNSAGQPGKTSDNYLRQIKNIFIATVTLASRAAISGGLPTEEALSLSDRYIQHSENLNNPEQVMNLQYNMIMDYTSLVAELNQGQRYNKFMRMVTGYVREHLTEDLNVNQMAKDLFLSRSYLSTRFKEEMGMTLSAYILDMKMKKAMEYLKHTDKSILEISSFLGFSSQGYFQNVFKKYAGMTPKEYREA